MKIQEAVHVLFYRKQIHNKHEAEMRLKLRSYLEIHADLASTVNLLQTPKASQMFLANNSTSNLKVTFCY